MQCSKRQKACERLGVDWKIGSVEDEVCRRHVHLETRLEMRSRTSVVCRGRSQSCSIVRSRDHSKNAKARTRSAWPRRYRRTLTYLFAYYSNGLEVAVDVRSLAARPKPDTDDNPSHPCSDDAVEVLFHLSACRHSDFVPAQAALYPDS